uniref:TNFR-Cys domain-containing protein n=1 Tax=Mastacembelus armatus TaxID=205130 RepID=A0A3Q3NHT2_9TELE
MLFILLLLFLIVECDPTYVHLNHRTGEVLICAQCPPGTHMTAHCTATTPTMCSPCKREHFTELWNYLPRCLYCNTLCTENQEVATECSPVSNRVCRCKEGFYWSDEFCIEHSECGPGYGVQSKGTSQRDTVCAKCPRGYFSNSSSALEPCVKHRQCASDQIVLLPGSLYQDRMCASCEDLQ